MSSDHNYDTMTLTNMITIDYDDDNDDCDDYCLS